ncbi:hypothetical protein FACS1894217_05780 [Clostridia bacterium]|nr:hypothetical protein FACS1894217_05780 [Clostridia bacterium]
MKARNSDWYKIGWSLDIKSMSWVEDTENQVDFIIKTLGLSGNERILDLACGYGRHSLCLSRRGFSVVGVDITQDYIDDAVNTAKSEDLKVDFILSDIREIHFENEFDVVLNLADGAIGYLENDEENSKIFDVIANALKPDGKHFMDICNAEHASAFFPKRSWEIGDNEFSFSEFEWDAEKRTMLYGGGGFRYGQVSCRPELIEGNLTRLYSINELIEIFKARNMEIVDTFSDYYGNKAIERELQLMVYSRKS